MILNLLRAKRVESLSSVTACNFYKKKGYTYKDAKDTVDEEQLYRLEKIQMKNTFLRYCGGDFLKNFKKFFSGKREIF